MRVHNQAAQCLFVTATDTKEGDDPVQTPISLDKGHIVSYISAKCETKQMYVFI